MFLFSAEEQKHFTRKNLLNAPTRCHNCRATTAPWWRSFAPVGRNATRSSIRPGAGDPSRATYWAGLRPATPDGTPIVGATRYRNLFLNTGHGTLGWTMACGSGRLLADLVSGRPPSVDPAPYRPG